MDCAYYMELISARLDGQLDDREAAALDAHLTACPRCRALAEQLSGLHGDWDQLEELEAPEGFARGVMERLGEKRKVVPLFRRPQLKALAGLAACAALCVGLYGAGLLDRSRGDLAQVNELAVSDPGGADMSLTAGVQSFADLSSMEDADSSTAPKKAQADGSAPEEPAPSTDGIGEIGVRAQTAEPLSAASITFDRLPEGWEALFPGVASPDAMQVSAQEAGAFLALLEEQGISCRVQGDLDAGGLCQLLLAEG